MIKKNILLYNSKDNKKIKNSVIIQEMFLYPSGNLHYGHIKNFAITSYISKFFNMIGRDTINCLGFDSLGTPAELTAQKNNITAKEWTINNIIAMEKDIESFSFEHNNYFKLYTLDFNYRKLSNELIKFLFNRNLIYKSKKLNNWCDNCKVTLSNEQSLRNQCWRCDNIIEKKETDEWFIRTSLFSKELFFDLYKNTYINWPSKVKELQKNWLGRIYSFLSIVILSQNNLFYSNCYITHLHIKRLLNLKFLKVVEKNIDKISKKNFIFINRDNKINCYLFVSLTESYKKTNTLYKYKKRISNNTFYISNKLISNIKELEEIYGINFRDKELENDFLSALTFSKEDCKDYIVFDYTMNIYLVIVNNLSKDNNIIKVQLDSDKKLNIKYDSDVNLFFSKYIKKNLDDFLNKNIFSYFYTLDMELIDKFNLDYLNLIIDLFLKKNFFSFSFDNLNILFQYIYLFKDFLFNNNSFENLFHDWNISRRKYWGNPLPILFCKNCNKYQITKKLFLKMYSKSDFEENLDEKRLVECSVCSRKGKLEKYTIDTFFDSSWYLFGYFKQNHNSIFDGEFFQTDYYVGGEEHALLHLLKLRFITKFLFNEKKINFINPTKNLITLGMILSESIFCNACKKYKSHFISKEDFEKNNCNCGKQFEIRKICKMSKSKKNFIKLKEFLKFYNTDIIIASILFTSPIEKQMLWKENICKGIARFYKTISKFISNIKQKYSDKIRNIKIYSFILENEIDRQIEKFLSKTIVIFNKIKKQMDTKYYSFNLILSLIMPLLRKISTFLENNYLIINSKNKGLYYSLFNNTLLLLNLFFPSIIYENFFSIFNKHIIDSEFIQTTKNQKE